MSCWQSAAKNLAFKLSMSCSSGFLQACWTHWLSPVAVQYGQNLHECGHPTHGQRVWLACWCSGAPLTPHGPHNTNIMTSPTLSTFTMPSMCHYKRNNSYRCASSWRNNLSLLCVKPSQQQQCTVNSCVLPAHSEYCSVKHKG